MTYLHKQLRARLSQQISRQYPRWLDSSSRRRSGRDL